MSNSVINQELDNLATISYKITDITSPDGILTNRLKCVKINQIKCPHCEYKSNVQVHHIDLLTGNYHGYRTFYLCDICLNMHRLHANVLVKLHELASLHIN